MVMGIQHRTTKFTASACIYRFFFLMVCFCCLSTQAIAASLVAEVNREEVAVGESFTLIVVADGVTGQPELAPLRVDFEVLRTSTRREVQITINSVIGDFNSLCNGDVTAIGNNIAIAQTFTEGVKITILGNFIKA